MKNIRAYKILDSGSDITKIKDKSALPVMTLGIFEINATGDVCTGDVIEFEEDIWIGEYPKATYGGTQKTRAQVIKESYGADKGQHTFTLKLETGGEQRIKGRNLYKHKVMRKRWKDEKVREEILNEKHERGSRVRASKYGTLIPAIKIEELPNANKTTGTSFKKVLEEGVIAADKKVNKSLKVGDKVEHRQFGKGTVKEIIQISGQDVLIILFKEGEKKLLVNYAPLKKL